MPARRQRYPPSGKLGICGAHAIGQPSSPTRRTGPAVRDNGLVAWSVSHTTGCVVRMESKPHVNMNGTIFIDSGEQRLPPLLPAELAPVEWYSRACITLCWLT